MAGTLLLLRFTRATVSGIKQPLAIQTANGRSRSEAGCASYSAATPSTGSGTVALKMSMMLRRLVGDL